MTVGDIYRWSWTDPHVRVMWGLVATDPYWCCSRIAIVDAAGRLVDTYWGCCSDNKVLDPSRVDLVHVANLGDLDPGPRDAHERYEPEDVVDLTHVNGGQMYVRKGAQESRAVRVRHWTRRRDAALADADAFQRIIDGIGGGP